MAYDSEVCPSCGNLRSECSSLDNEWFVHSTRCWATAARDWGKRLAEDRHKGADGLGSEPHPLDGVSFYTARTVPSEDSDPLA